MDIRFCEACQESIPDADFESGRALAADGRSICGTCIARRALVRPASSIAPIALALLALGGVVWLALRPAPKTGVVPEVAQAIRDQAAQTLADAGKASEARLTQATKPQGEALFAITGALEKLGVDAKALAERTAQERVEVQGRGDALEGRLVSLERQLADVHTWLRELKARAEAAPPAKPEPEEARPVAPAPSVPPAEPTPAEPATPAPAAPAPPTTDAATLQHWIDLLKDPNAGIAFSATLELSRLKDLRAVAALVNALKTYRDFYVRLGAADALRELKACDAVPSLIDALDDKDDLVRTAANQALIHITGHQEPFAANLPGNELKRAQKGWTTWWKENEDGVRSRLGQPRG
jgi:hypothetical protein